MELYCFVDRLVYLESTFSTISDRFVRAHCALVLLLRWKNIFGLRIKEIIYTVFRRSFSSAWCLDLVQTLQNASGMAQRIRELGAAQNCGSPQSVCEQRSGSYRLLVSESVDSALREARP